MVPKSSWVPFTLRCLQVGSVTWLAGCCQCLVPPPLDLACAFFTKWCLYCRRCPGAQAAQLCQKVLQEAEVAEAGK